LRHINERISILVDEFRQAAHVENSISGQGEASNSGGDRKRKKKSRWASSNDGNEKTFIPGMPTILPSNLNPDQQEAYLGNYHIDSLSPSNRSQIHPSDDHKILYLSFNSPSTNHFSVDQRQT
jgi:hypothetical protein